MFHKVEWQHMQGAVRFLMAHPVSIFSHIDGSKTKSLSREVRLGSSSWRLLYRVGKKTAHQTHGYNSVKS